MENASQKQEMQIGLPELIQKGLLAVLAALTVFLLISALVQFREFQFVGAGVTATNTITVTGEGEILSKPDRAHFTVTIQQEAKTAKDAQRLATEKINAVVAYLKDAGLEEKDIKTSDYSLYPQYDYMQSICPRSGYCEPGKQQLRGFQLSQSIEVKSKDLDGAGTLLEGVVTAGASQVSGLNFTVEDEDQLEVGARDKAIEDARGKAEELAQSLGVKLVRVVGFSENGGGYPQPMYAKTMAYDMAEGAAAPAPEIPAGENKITANVSVTYEIR